MSEHDLCEDTSKTTKEDMWAASIPVEGMIVLSWSFKPDSALTPALAAVTKMIVAGLSDAEIAVQRQTSTATVAKQVRTLIGYYNANSRFDLIYILNNMRQGS